MKSTQKFGGKNLNLIFKKIAMKNIGIKILGIFFAFVAFTGCKKYDEDWNYPGGKISPYIAIYDVRNLFRDAPVALNQNSLFGSTTIAAIVVSDHSAGNLPKDLLIVQNNPRLSFLRGLAINIGAAAAASYVPGDSVHINLVGAKLERVGGILQVTNITTDKVEKKASGIIIPTSCSINSGMILANPGDFESTLVTIVEGGFVPAATAGQLMSGDYTLTDGFGLLSLKTEADAGFSNTARVRMANYQGIVFMKAIGDSLAPYIRPRKLADIVPLNSVYETPEIIITGWHSDPKGTDANYEYIQFIATKDIDFTETPFSVVTSNNAGASNPGGVPVNGWATGGLRTYKINISTGLAAKGSIFYVGGTGKTIDSNDSSATSPATDISSANWVATRNYSNTTGNDFGAISTNLLANSGNAYGVAVFKGLTVDKNSIPVDVMWVATGGTLYAGNDGYRICNNDFYRIISPCTLQEQPFYRSGSNLSNMSYTTPSDAGLYNSWSGEYNLTLGRWTKARTKVLVQLRNASTIAEIERPENIVTLVQ